MADILEEAAALVQCRECPWYKACVLPMRVSPEELRGQLLANLPPGDTASPYDMNKLLADIASAAQNMMLEGCPVFIKRLRANEELAQRIKRMMQRWSDETAEEG